MMARFVTVALISLAASALAAQRPPEAPPLTPKTGKVCPAILDKKIVAQFTEAKPHDSKDDKNVYDEGNLHLRSALTSNEYKRSDILSQQEKRGGDWGLTDEDPLGGNNSSLCTYTNPKLDKDVQNIKVSAKISDTATAK